MRRLSELIFKLRGGIWTLLFVAILFMTKGTSWERICLSVVLVVLGQVWRCWAAGTIGLYRGENVKARELAVTGAYSLMRNPLYFGNFMIGLGWSIIAGWLAVIVFVLSFYILYVKVIIPHEEAFLLDKFGHEYEDYCSKVKRFFPSFSSFKAGRYDPKIIIHSEIHTILTTTAGTLVIIAAALCYT